MIMWPGHEPAKRGPMAESGLLRKTDRDRLSRQAAYLRARHSFTQEEIGRTLGGISQSHVSRLLNHAIEKGWLFTELRFAEESLTLDERRDLQALLEPRRLVGRLEEICARRGGRVPSVRVFDSGSDAPTSGAFEIRCRRFGRSAAGRIDELLRRSRIVGVTWGRTVSSLIDGLTASNRQFNLDVPLTFVPVSAELITLAAPTYSSSQLADRLIDTVNRGMGERLGLGGVPAFIPRRYSAAKAQAVREYLLDAESYRRIFSGETPFVTRIDTLITSVGSAERPLGGAMGEVLSAAGISAADLRSIIAGDIGGVLIARPDATEDEDRIVDDINEMWTGITRTQVLGVADRAEGGDGPGVVVAAIGRERTGIVAELIRRSMINELLIDWDLARSLEEHFRSI